MDKTPRRTPDDPAQHKRFLEAAREAQADETKEGADRAFKKVISSPKKNEKELKIAYFFSLFSRFVSLLNCRLFFRSGKAGINVSDGCSFLMRSPRRISDAYCLASIPSSIGKCILGMPRKSFSVGLIGTIIA